MLGPIHTISTLLLHHIFLEQIPGKAHSESLKQPINAGDSARVTLSLWLCLKILGNQHKNLLKTCEKTHHLPHFGGYKNGGYIEPIFGYHCCLGRRLGKTACGL